MAAKKTFEENMARLEEIVGKLEKGDAQLSDSLKLFEEGTKLIAQCRTELDKAEQQVVKLMKGPDGAPAAERAAAAVRRTGRVAGRSQPAEGAGPGLRHGAGGGRHGAADKRTGTGRRQDTCAAGAGRTGLHGGA